MKKLQLTLALVIGLLMMIPAQSIAQKTTLAKSEKMLMHLEQPEDPYMPNEWKNHKTGPAYHVRNSIFFSTQVNVDEDGENIFGDAANEPSIGIDPVNPLRMVIGWRQFDNVSSNFRQAGYAYTEDGGETWIFPGSINPGVFRSDPVLDTDSTGRFYYNSLTVDNQSNYTCDVFRNQEGSFVWDEGTDAQGGDKQWMVIDRTGSAGDGNVYSFWTNFYSICYPGNFTRSVDGGASYEDCVPVESEPYWGTLAVGSAGELYIVGAGQFGGLTFVKSTGAVNPKYPVSWDFSVQVDIGGELSGWTDINPAGLLGQAYIAVDNSGGPGEGYIYVLASVDPVSGPDPANVMFARSTDGGLSWDAPVKINDDATNNKYQWFGTMSVAPNGRIDAIWLDNRDASSGSFLSSLYYAYSMDQGETWSVNERLSDGFDPHVGWPNQEKMGDYFHMVSDNESAHLAWCGTFNSEQDVYYGRITPLITAIPNLPEVADLMNISCSPNPFSGTTSVRYFVPVEAKVNITLFDVYGKAVKTIVDEQKLPGNYSVQITSDQIAKGTFLCRLSIGENRRTTRIIHF